MYQNRLREMIRYGLIGIAIGIALVIGFVAWGAGQLENVTVTAKDVLEFAALLVLFAWIFMGVPYVWKALGQVLRLSQAGTLIFWTVIFFFRFIITIGFSWIIFPVMFLYTLIRVTIEKKERDTAEDQITD